LVCSLYYPVWYRDSAGNTTEENSGVFSLIRLHGSGGGGGGDGGAYYRDYLTVTRYT